MFSVFTTNAGDDFGAIFPFFDKVWDELGGLLAIGIDGDGGLAGSVIETSSECGFFAEIAGKGEDFDFGVLSGEILNDLEGVVGGTVIDDDDFKFVRDFFDGGEKGIGDKILDAFKFVVNGNYNGEKFFSRHYRYIVS